MKNNDEPIHWLVRPASIRKLWVGFIVVLALVVAAQAVIYIKGYFGIDGWFGFAAVYGFACCLLMVLVAKILGLLLKRPQDYYEAPGKDCAADQSQNKVQEHTDGV